MITILIPILCVAIGCVLGEIFRRKGIDTITGIKEEFE